MEILDADISSFVIRAWIEESGNEQCGATWRGHITHVASGKRRYFQDLQYIASFITPYLEHQGVRFDEIW